MNLYDYPSHRTIRLVKTYTSFTTVTFPYHGVALVDVNPIGEPKRMVSACCFLVSGFGDFVFKKVSTIGQLVATIIKYSVVYFLFKI